MGGQIADIKKFSIHDGPGIRTTVFMKGCPLKCVWCQNPESISSYGQLSYVASKCINCGQCVSVCNEKAHGFEGVTHIFEREKCKACGSCAKVCLGNALIFFGKQKTVEELLPVLLEDRSFYEHSGGGVTLSGGEPLLQTDFCAELLKALKKENINTAIETCGFASRKALDKIIPYTDYFLYDIKQFDEEKHIKCTGQSNSIILENLQYLDKQGKSLEIRIPLVPMWNDDEDTLHKIGSFLGKLKNINLVRILPYHKLAACKYFNLAMENTLPDVPVPSDDDIERTVKLLKTYGVPAISGKA